MINRGVLYIDKPAGITSFDVVRAMRKILSLRRVGHTGTLDPFATGLLPICFGDATRYADYITFADKTYEATLRLGIKTDTGDITGATIAQQEIPKISQQQLQDAVAFCVTITSQVPPRYSAVKVKGKRAYELARQGVEFTLPPRPVAILNFSITHVALPHITYRATVSKGTYIRTLSETFASQLGSVATTTALRRLAVGSVSVQDAVALDALTPDNWPRKVVPLETALAHLPIVELNDEQSVNYVHGRRFALLHPDIETCLVLHRSHMVGLGNIVDGVLHPRKVLA